jgi:hypothetical protein
MRSKIVIFSVLIVAIAVVSFGFSHKKSVAKADELITKIDSSKVSKKAQKTDLFYAVGGTYSRSIRKSELQNSKMLNDFIEGYPVNWISAYISVEVSANNNGLKTSLWSKNDVLSDEQKKMLAGLEIDAEVVVRVKYNTKNVITDALEENEMNVSLTVIPEIEAVYIGGYENMISYLKENSRDKITMIGDKGVKPSVLRFSIDKTGKADNIKIIQKSENIEIDNLLIELIENMPKWNAAKNLKGESVSQQFDFKVGKMDGC